MANNPQRRPKEVPGMRNAIEQRRVELGITPGEFAKAAGVTTEALRPLRNGVNKHYSEKVQHGVARALRWPTDWYPRVLAGDDPAGFPDTHHHHANTDGDADLWSRVNRLEERFRSIEQALDRLVERLESRD